VYISGGVKDETVHPQMTNMQDDVYQKYKAKVLFEIVEKSSGH